MVDANYNYSDSVWQDIYKHLKSNGLDVYSPSTKTGECTKEYVVVKNNGSAKKVNASTDEDYYSIMCYVPRNKYSALEVLVQKVKKAMKELKSLEKRADRATDMMCAFLVLNISSLQLIPINMIAYRSQYGSVNPTGIVGMAIVATAISTLTGALFAKIMCRRDMNRGY